MYLRLLSLTALLLGRIETAVQGARLRVYNRKINYWLARGERKRAAWNLARMRAIFAGMKQETVSYWRARIDMLEPGDPILDPPPHLLEEQP